MWTGWGTFSVIWAHSGLGSPIYQRAAYLRNSDKGSPLPWGW